MNPTTDAEAGRAEMFAPVSYEQWRTQVEQDLKGAPFDKKLTTSLVEGLRVQPLYTAEQVDLAGDPSGFPGQAPFTRGWRAPAEAAGGWGACLAYDLAEPEAVHRAVLRDLNRGAAGLWLIPDRAFRAGKAPTETPEGGMRLTGLADLAAALEGVVAEAAPIRLEAGAAGPQAAALLAAWAGPERLNALTGSIHFDPLGVLAAEGELPASPDRIHARMAQLVAWAADAAPGLKTLAVSTLPYAAAGAHAVQETAYALATGVAYLRALAEAGVNPALAASKLLFVVAVGRDALLEVAKLRALRLVWSRALEAVGVPPEARGAEILAVSNPFYRTQRDPWVNLLRGTAETFAAVVGGADHVATAPLDAALGEAGEFGRRLALNTQLILREECRLAAAADPAGGSWHVEALTRDVAGAAWRQFQAIEAQGGMGAALASGAVAREVEATAAERRKRAATRKDAIIGVSEYPLLDERPVERDEAAPSQGERLSPRPAADRPAPGGSDIPALAAALAAGCPVAAVSAAVFGERETMRAPALTAWRLAEPFERLRDAADAHAARTGRRPSIFLANMGTIPEHKARAGFSVGFFEAGGVQALNNDGFLTVADAVAAFQASQTDAAVICSTDDNYVTLVPELAPALVAAGARHLFVAGRPGEREAAWRAAGVGRFIFMGADAAATLASLLTDMGALSTEARLS